MQFGTNGKKYHGEKRSNQNCYKEVFVIPLIQSWDIKEKYVRTTKTCMLENILISLSQWPVTLTYSPKIIKNDLQRSIKK